MQVSISKVIDGFISALKKEPDKINDYIPLEVDADLFEHTFRPFLLSTVLGMDHAQDNLTLADAWNVLAGDKNVITFNEALLFAQSRIPVTRQEFDKLSNEVKFRAFTVAALSEHDTINTLKNQLRIQLENGGTIADFISKASGKKLLDDAGFSNSNPRYWENVYRTNMQTNYSAGREMQFLKNPPDYCTVEGIVDNRQCPICAPRDGVTLPYNDPWWEENNPPYHHQCRCHKRGISKEEAEVLGVEIKKAPDSIKAPQPGFGGNPVKKESFWNITKEMAERAEKFNIDGDIIALAKQLNLNNAIKNIIGSYPSYEVPDVRLPKNSFVKISPNKIDPGKKYTELNKQLKAEVDAAFMLARKGKKVYMLPEATAKKAKSADLFVDGKFFEVKNVTGNIETIKKQFSTSLSQAENALFIINNKSISKALLKESLKARLLDKNKKTGLFLGLLNNEYLEWSYDYILK